MILCTKWRRSVVTQAVIVPSASRTTPLAGRAVDSTGFWTRMTKFASIPGCNSSLGSAISERIVTRCVFGINRLVDLRNLPLKHAVRIGDHPDLHRLAQVKKRDLTFHDIRQHPFDRDVGDGIRRRHDFPAAPEIRAARSL